MTASQTKSAPYNVGYGKPPRHTQFRKGQSGNPGGRPRREPVERLKALTLQEAYRGVVIKENGIAVPMQAVQAILRSQIELAMSGNVRAQRDVLKAVQAYERADAEAATVDAYVEVLVQQATDLEKAIEAAKRAAPTAEKKMSYVEAAQRICFLLGLGKPRSEAESDVPASETCAHRNEAVTEESDAERNAAAPAPSADSAPQPEKDTAPGALPVASAPPSADPPADRPWRSRSDRYARHRARESTPPPSADSPPGFLRNKCLRHWKGNSAQPFNVTWKEFTSGQSRPQKSRNSLLNSVFSGNAGARRVRPPPWRRASQRIS